MANTIIPTAEEQADIHGVRVEDPAYRDNVVFNKEGLNELLKHIKNYPIIDAEYVDEDATDDLSGLPVWDNYTEGTPCIKIKYGDSENPSGNLSSTDVE